VLKIGGQRRRIGEEVLWVRKQKRAENLCGGGTSVVRMQPSCAKTEVSTLYPEVFGMPCNGPGEDHFVREKAIRAMVWYATSRTRPARPRPQRAVSGPAQQPQPALECEERRRCGCGNRKKRESGVVAH
jgi:hypothetical protein